MILTDLTDDEIVEYRSKISDIAYDIEYDNEFDITWVLKYLKSYPNID